MSERFYVKPAYAGSNSWNVMDRERTNDFGEEFCVDPCLTLEEAEQLVQQLNEPQQPPPADGQPEQPQPRRGMELTR